MTDPTPTSPGEIAKLSALANNDPYRTEVLVLLATIRESVKRHETWAKSAEEWMIQHDKDDALRFQSIESRLGPAVTSGVNFNETKQQAEGMRKLIVGVVGVIGLIGGGIIGLVELIKYWKLP